MRDTVIELAKRQFMKWLISKLPFLNFGPFNIFATLVVGKLITKIVDVTILGYKFRVISNNVDKQVKRIEDRAKKENLTTEEIKELEKDIITLISFK